MTGPPDVAEPRVAIGMPHGSPARGGALEWVMASATPADGFVDAGVAVDGVAIACRVRRLPDHITISAWCDTRGLPPGLHEIAVHGRWDAGVRASESRLMVVTVGEPAEWWNVAPVDAPAAVVVRISDPKLDESLARTALGGPPLVLLDEDCVPGPGAVERIAAAFADPGVDVVIGDEASMVAEKRWMRWRKRAFQPEALPCVDLVGPLLAVGPRAADVLCDALPLRAGIYGLALELLDRGLQTLALPHVLALTPQARMPTDDAPARAAVERLAARRGRPVTIGDGPVAGLREVRWPVPAAPGVVAVIPSCTPALAARCLAGVAERTSYAGLRAVVVDSSADEDEMRRVVEAAPIPATRVRYPSGEPFNYQVAVNLGARQAADAEEVLFLNDDVLPLTSDWLTRMVELLTLPGVGIVGALLRYPDGRIQHAGVQIGEGSGHRYHDAPGDARGHRFELLVPGNPEAVTGACMLVRAELLEQLGGHDERYVHVYGDVDLCYRASQRGWRVAWCPGAALEHLESASYGSAVDEGDIGRFLELWRHDRAPTTSNRVRA